MVIRVLLNGPKRRVAVLDRVEKEYLHIETRAQGTLARKLGLYACGENLPEEHLKFEGRHSDGRGREIAVFAFKAKQVRLYGIICNVKGMETFIGTEIDPAKKKQKADQGKLARAALNARLVLDDLEGTT